MAPCTFCGETIEKGTGLMYVKKDGKLFHFCSRKCEKNMIQLKRKPRNTTWTAEHRVAKAQAIAAAGTKKPTKKKTKAAKTSATEPAKTVKKTPKAGKNAVVAKKAPAKTAKKAAPKDEK